MADNRSTVGCIALAAVVTVAVLWFLAPAFHWLWFDILWLNPVLWFLVVVGLAIALGLGQDGLLYGWAVAAECVVGLLLLVYMVFAGALADQFLVQGINPTVTDKLPNTKGIRYLPYEVAVTYAKSRMNDPLYVAGDLDPIDKDNELDWVAPRVPNGLWNQLTSKTNGVVIVKPDGQLQQYYQKFEVGEDMYVTSNIKWALWGVKYGVEISDIYYLFDNGQILAIAPYVSYDFKFPVMVPKWAGVFVVHGDGTIEDLSPQLAQADPRFVGQRLYPEGLEHRKGESWQYRDGVFNAWFVHYNQVEMPTIQNSENQMPYLVPADPNPYWFIGFEPYGRSYSIYKILLTDAHTGADLLYQVPVDKSEIGPNKALEFIRSAQPNVQWYREGDKGSSGTIIAIEPRPLVIKGHLYWQVSMTSTGHAGVTNNPVLDADTSAVVLCYNQQELQAFVAGESNCHPGQANPNPPNAPVGLTSGTSSVDSIDLTKLSDQDLRRLMQRILDEMNRRSK